MRILVVDDEQPALEGLLGTLKKVCSADSEWNEAEICGFRDPLEALCSAEKVNYDIAFLDIEMHKLNGISLAQKLKSLSPYINIIFTTGYSEYGMDAFKLHASGYITKPVTAEKVRKELDELRHPIDGGAGERDRNDTNTEYNRNTELNRNTDVATHSV